MHILYNITVIPYLNFENILEAATVFTKPLEDANINEDETVTFTCETSKSNIKPKWFQGEKELKKNKNTKIVSKGSIHSLTMTSCKPEDCANITAKLNNAETSAILNVTG